MYPKRPRAINPLQALCHHGPHKFQVHHPTRPNTSGIPEHSPLLDGCLAVFDSEKHLEVLLYLQGYLCER